MGKSTLGEQIKKRRLDLGLTLDRCAEKAGMSTRALINIESDLNRPSPNISKALCQVLKISITQIVTPLNNEQ